MSNFLCNVSDETLFLKMSQGDRTSQGVLLGRYEKVGFQYVNQLIRTNNLKNYRDIDFIDLIDDTIYKAFRYYQVGKISFFAFCSDLLNQALTHKVNQIIADSIKENEAIRLDALISSNDDTSYHEIISDTTQLSSSEQFDIDNFLDKIENVKNPRTRRALKVYLMYKLDMTIKEITEKLGISTYDARTAISEAKELCKHSDTIKLK